MDSGYLDIVDAVTGDGEGGLRSEPYAKIDKEFNEDVADQVRNGVVSVRADMWKGWAERSVWPVPVLSDLYSNERLAQDIVYVTDSRNFSRFDPPRTYEEVRTPPYAYFAGVAAGDGGFNGGPSSWSITDGGRPEQLDASRTFIRRLSDVIGILFGIPESSQGIRKRGNRIILTVSNKWFGRFIQSVFDLPESYKKGDLKRPEVFNQRENRKYFWRGVVDADGCVPTGSYRVSLSSATKSFLEECTRDLEGWGISVAEITKPAAYMLRVSPRDFETFATEIGFSHPRKKNMLLEKLLKGARNYVYDGRKEYNILDDGFYDLTSMDRLRVMGVGDYLLDAREEQRLYQREMADELGVSGNQIYCWENEVCAMPVDVFVEVIGSTLGALKIFLREKPKFKVGVRGRDSSLVDLPIQTSSEVDRIASNAVASKREMRIRRRNEDVAEELENVFGTGIIRSERKFYTKHWTVIEFFKTFYSYRPNFQEYSEDEIQGLENQLEIPS